LARPGWLADLVPGIFPEILYKIFIPDYFALS